MLNSNSAFGLRKEADMKEQDRKAHPSELELTCRLWIAACQARDVRIGQLEQECQALRQRVARLSRRLQRQVRLPRERAEVRFAR